MKIFSLKIFYGTYTVTGNTYIVIGDLKYLKGIKVLADISTYALCEKLKLLYRYGK